MSLRTLHLFSSRATAACVIFAFTLFSLFFFLNDPPTPEIYPLPLHDALPISRPPLPPLVGNLLQHRLATLRVIHDALLRHAQSRHAADVRLNFAHLLAVQPLHPLQAVRQRSEEHTSETPVTL